MQPQTNNVSLRAHFMGAVWGAGVLPLRPWLAEEQRADVFFGHVAAAFGQPPRERFPKRGRIAVRSRVSHDKIVPLSKCGVLIITDFFRSVKSRAGRFGRAWGSLCRKRADLPPVLLKKDDFHLFIKKCENLAFSFDSGAIL